MGDKKEILITVRLTPETAKRIEDRAWQLRMTRPELIRRGIDMLLKDGQ